MILAKESLILIGICLADLVSTIVLLCTHQAVEGNPLMSFYLSRGVGTLIIMKLTLMLLPIFIAEWSRQYRPQFVKIALRAAIGLYVGSYIFVFLSANVVPAVAHTFSPSETQVVQARR